MARVSSHVDDFNNRYKVMTAKLLKQVLYQKLRKAFLKLYRRHFDLVSKNNVGLNTHLLQGFSGPEFMATGCMNSKLSGKNNFPYHFKRIIARYKKIGYNIDVLRQTACLIANPVKVNILAYIFHCPTVGRTLD